MARTENDEQALVCVVEIPKGTRNKYEYDPVLGGIKFDRLLMSAATYPTDYGYLRDTLGQDDGPLDALVCLYEPTFPGCLIPVKPLGMFKMRDEAGVDDKIICVPLHDPTGTITRSWRSCPSCSAPRSSSSSRSTRTSSGASRSASTDGAPARTPSMRSPPPKSATRPASGRSSPVQPTLGGSTMAKDHGPSVKNDKQ
jgi:inorganic pyrophosphatase